MSMGRDVVGGKMRGRPASIRIKETSRKEYALIRKKKGTNKDYVIARKKTRKAAENLKERLEKWHSSRWAV